MLVRSVCTFDYLFDLQRLLRDRLAHVGDIAYEMRDIGNGICIQIDAERSKALSALAAALGNMLSVEGVIPASELTLRTCRSAWEYALL